MTSTERLAGDRGIIVHLYCNLRWDMRKGAGKATVLMKECEKRLEDLRPLFEEAWNEYIRYEKQQSVQVRNRWTEVKEELKNKVNIDFDKHLYQVSKYARQPKRLEDLFLRMKEVEQSLSREE